MYCVICCGKTEDDISCHGGRCREIFNSIIVSFKFMLQSSCENYIDLFETNKSGASKINLLEMYK